MKDGREYPVTGKLTDDIQVFKIARADYSKVKGFYCVCEIKSSDVCAPFSETDNHASCS